MRILQVCKKFPYPLRDGEVIAIHQLTRGFYEAGQKVTVAAINTTKHFFPPDELPVENRALADFHSVLLETDVNWWDALRGLFTGDSFNVQRFVSPDFEKLLTGILRENEFDIVQLEGLYLLPYLLAIRKYTKAKVVLRAHNVEHLIWERSSKNAKPGEKKWYQQMLAARMKEFEIYHMNSCDALVPITEVDGKRFAELGCKIPMHTCPVGIQLNNNLPALIPDDKSETKTEQAVCYIGNMDWIPNREGVEWFLDQVWPKVISHYPEVKLFIAGRNMPPDLLERSAPNAEMVGEVENARAFIRSKSLMVVPLFSGSGMRIKILEALAEKKPVVTTTVGAEGITTSGEEILLVADTADAFARQIKKCLKEPPFAHQMGETGYEFVRKNYNNSKLVSDLLKFYSTLLKNGKGH